MQNNAAGPVTLLIVVVAKRDSIGVTSAIQVI